MTLPTPSKTELRTAALARRSALSEADRAAASDALARLAFPLPIRPDTVVAGYAPIRSEIDPVPLMRTLAGRGARQALPAIVGRDAPLVFRAWTPEQMLQPGAYGILAPAAGAPQLIPDIVLVPLAAFDRAGHRIGYGAGYYDRTFAQLRAIKTFAAIGLAFDTQEIAAIPAAPHDVALDYVLTETRVIDFRSS
jgi:5-formyltetrahydrofolate cyclo-ligase